MTTTGAAPERALAHLDARFSGDVLRPGDRGYAAARRVWNGSVDHRPALIVRPRTAKDVATTLLNAREAGMEIAVRGGGHSVPGHSMSDGGMTIDLSGFNQVVVDAGARSARVGGGALLMDVAEAATPAGLAFPFGHVSHTGIGGLTLGGGIGWIMRKHGLAIDSLRSAELVTAEGELISASEAENEELFWALRGGGGNFGVVTEFEFDLHPFGPEVLAGMVLHPLENAGEALRFSRDFMDEAPAELTVFETFMTVPPTDPFPAELHDKPAFALAMAYAGPIAEGETAVRPLREFGCPALDLVGPMSYAAVQTLLDQSAPHGMRNYMKAHWLRELPDAAIDDPVERHAEVLSPMSLIINGRMGGAIEEISADATAFAHRDADRLLLAVSAWWEGDDEEQIEWCRGVFDAMSPYSTGGVYVNFLGDEGEARVRASYEEATWRRLVAVKDRWDPENVFCLNQNIPPSGKPSPERSDQRPPRVASTAA
jgi:FAD/FMN-containing dehydrogenase